MPKIQGEVLGLKLNRNRNHSVLFLSLPIRNVRRGFGRWKAENTLASLRLNYCFISVLGPERREQSHTHALLPHTSSGSPAILTHNALRSWRQRRVLRLFKMSMAPEQQQTCSSPTPTAESTPLTAFTR